VRVATTQDGGSVARAVQCMDKQSWAASLIQQRAEEMTQRRYASVPRTQRPQDSEVSALRPCPELAPGSEIEAGDGQEDYGQRGTVEALTDSTVRARPTGRTRASPGRTRPSPRYTQKLPRADMKTSIGGTITDAGVESAVGRTRMVPIAAVFASLFLVFACLVPPVLADNQPRHGPISNEGLLGAGLGAMAGAAMAQIADKPEWLPDPFSCSAITVPLFAALGGTVLPKVGRNIVKQVKKLYGSDRKPPSVETMLRALTDTAHPALSAPAQEIVGEWLRKWHRKFTGPPDVASPLGLFGDAAVHEVASQLRAAVNDDLYSDLLAIDVARCDGSGDCAERIESFMVEGSNSQRAGLILLQNVDAFTSADPEENSRRFADTIGALETSLGPTAKGGYKALGSPKCRKGQPCHIYASLFAILATSAHLDTPACNALSAGLTTSGMKSIAARERTQTMWAKNRFGPSVQASLTAIGYRWTNDAALVCSNGDKTEL